METAHAPTSYTRTRTYKSHKYNRTCAQIHTSNARYHTHTKTQVRMQMPHTGTRTYIYYLASTYAYINILPAEPVTRRFPSNCKQVTHEECRRVCSHSKLDIFHTLIVLSDEPEISRSPSNWRQNTSKLCARVVIAPINSPVFVSHTRMELSRDPVTNMLSWNWRHCIG